MGKRIAGALVVVLLAGLVLSGVTSPPAQAADYAVDPVPPSAGLPLDFTAYVDNGTTVTPVHGNLLLNPVFTIRDAQGRALYDMCVVFGVGGGVVLTPAALAAGTIPPVFPLQIGLLKFAPGGANQCTFDEAVTAGLTALTGLVNLALSGVGANFNADELLTQLTQPLRDVFHADETCDPRGSAAPHTGVELFLDIPFTSNVVSFGFRDAAAVPRIFEATVYNADHGFDGVLESQTSCLGGAGRLNPVFSFTDRTTRATDGDLTVTARTPTNFSLHATVVQPPPATSDDQLAAGTPRPQIGVPSKLIGGLPSSLGKTPVCTLSPIKARFGGLCAKPAPKTTPLFNVSLSDVVPANATYGMQLGNRKPVTVGGVHTAHTIGSIDALVSGLPTVNGRGVLGAVIDQTVDGRFVTQGVHYSVPGAPPQYLASTVLSQLQLALRLDPDTPVRDPDPRQDYGAVNVAMTKVPSTLNVSLTTDTAPTSGAMRVHEEHNAPVTLGPSLTLRIPIGVGTAAKVLTATTPELTSPGDLCFQAGPDCNTDVNRTLEHQNSDYDLLNRPTDRLSVFASFPNALHDASVHIDTIPPGGVSEPYVYVDNLSIQRFEFHNGGSDLTAGHVFDCPFQCYDPRQYPVTPDGEQLLCIDDDEAPFPFAVGQPTCTNVDDPFFFVDTRQLPLRATVRLPSHRPFNGIFDTYTFGRPGQEFWAADRLIWVRGIDSIDNPGNCGGYTDVDTDSSIPFYDDIVDSYIC